MSLRIEGDELEQHRIRLERDIANTIPLPPSMSSSSTRPDDVDEEDASSVDLPRHNSNHRQSFHSFEHPSQLDSDFYSRHGDEDPISLDLEMGHTMITAAHPASTVTLTAGLRGRDSTTAKSPRMNQEFDPDRPLQPLLGAAAGLSMFNSTVQSNKTKTNKNNELSQHTFEPIIVDSTADLDRLLKTGFRQPNLSRSHSQPDPRIEVEDAHVPPKSLNLSQALSNHFDPKRPRSTPASVQSFQFSKRDETPTNKITARSALRRQPEISQPSQTQQSEKQREEKEKEKGEKENKHLTSAAGGPHSQSRIHFQEPIDNDGTPRPRKIGFAPDAVSSAQRPILVDRLNRQTSAAHDRSKTQVHLPDITNLTAAVESPMRGSEKYLAAKIANRHFAVDVITALDGLQTRLEALERDNGISRRRVQELEYDLEECKEEIAFKREKMKARELRGAGHDRNVGQGRGVARDDELRYLNAVEEKRALEVLITTMRQHVTRLTSELALHRSLIDGLREDVDASDEARAEVQTLTTKVERLSGEVERLKTFIEENAKKRKRSGENSASYPHQEKNAAAAMPSQAEFDIADITNPLMQREECSPFRNEQEEFFSRTQDVPEEGRETLELESENEEEPSQERDDDREGEEDTQPGRDDEEPTASDDQPVETTEQYMSSSQRYVEDSELAKVQAEILERRSERSISLSASSNRSVVSEIENGNPEDGRGSPVPYPSAPTQTRFGAIPSLNRPSERDNLRNTTHRQSSNPLPFGSKSSARFHQIRGSRMERLFFAVPDHDGMTCHVCHRRKRRGFEINQGTSPNEDEQLLRAYFQTEKGGGRKKNIAPGEGEGEIRPPQTILARVLRDMEDDFSHYKAIYIELAEQYAVIDAVSNVAKRNVLADHLREVIDSLEQKGDQIAALYQLLHFRDKPLKI